MTSIVEIKLPDGTTKRIRVLTTLANSKAGQRAFASSNIGGSPHLNATDYRAFDKTRASRVKALKNARTQA
jgi:hypothetical protein